MFFFNNISGYLSGRWQGEGGYKEFLALAFPLILCTSSIQVQQFINRVFLTWYSPSAIAAASPAGNLNLALMCIFLGAVGYTDIFIAQYYGAGKYSMIGPVLWQGIYLALIGSIVMVTVASFSRTIFELIGHPPAVREDEIVYFRILCLGAFPTFACGALSGFFAGRGRMWPVMWVNLGSALLNTFLDYLLIFGKGIFPGLGIGGAAIATIVSGIAAFAAYFVWIGLSAFNAQHHTLRQWRLDRPLLARMMTFGFPSGVHLFLDLAGITMFLFIMGSLGTVSLAATNIAFNISSFSFLPLMGSGIAVSVLVGQYLGRDRPDIAARSVYSGFHLTFFYIVSMCLLYVFASGIFIAPFALNADPASFSAIQDLVRVLLWFVAVYSLFDTLNIIFSSAVKGAGDTRFVMKIVVVESSFVLIIPTYIVLVILKGGIFSGWVIVSGYVIILGLSFLIRFLGGRWKSMRVIDPHVPSASPSFLGLSAEES